MRPRFSLIVATYGRTEELLLFLQSLERQTFPKHLFEVIVVDQNAPGVIDQIVLRFEDKFAIVHIRSDRKGLSYNRNIGISRATGDYLAVPDDDCQYYPDTLEQANEALGIYKEPDMLIGRVFSRHKGTHVFKRTPKTATVITKQNFYETVSSIAMIFRNADIVFDENFGIGEMYPANEDGDLILSFLDTGRKVVYSPTVEFDHPPYDASTMSIDKLYKYGIGFGAMCRKHFSAPVFFLFFKSLVFQVLMMGKAALSLDFVETRRRLAAFKGRRFGFFSYRPTTAD